MRTSACDAAPARLSEAGEWTAGDLPARRLARRRSSKEVTPTGTPSSGSWSSAAFGGACCSPEHTAGALCHQYRIAALRVTRTLRMQQLRQSRLGVSALLANSDLYLPDSIPPDDTRRSKLSDRSAVEMSTCIKRRRQATKAQLAA